MRRREWPHLLGCFYSLWLRACVRRAAYERSMQVPLTVSFHGIPVSETIRAACWAEAEKLEHWFDRITSCHVTASLPHRHQRSAKPFDLRVRLTLPGHEIIVDRVKTQPRGIQKPELIVHETFDEVRRQLQDCVARMRGNVKLHEAIPPQEAHSQEQSREDANDDGWMR
jgi:ribosome-associated translation inhibitor RaiA